MLCVNHVTCNNSFNILILYELQALAHILLTRKLRCRVIITLAQIMKVVRCKGGI